MVAVLQPLTVRPVRRPTYNNAAIANFGNWYVANEPALSQYFASLEGDGDFFDFCASQYDIELLHNPQPVYARRVIDRRDARECFDSEQCPSDRTFR